jgi:hypothetical protein
MSEDEINRQSPAFLFGKILTKLDDLEDRQEENQTVLIRKLDLQEERISKLESLKSWVLGGAAVGGSGGIAGWLKHLGGGN